MGYSGPHFEGCVFASDKLGGESEDYLHARTTHSLPPGLQTAHGYAGPPPAAAHGFFRATSPPRRNIYSSSSEESFSARPHDRHRNQQRRPPRKHSRASKHKDADAEAEESNFYCEPEFQHDSHHRGAVWSQGPSKIDLDASDNTGNKPNLPPPRRGAHYPKHMHHKHFGNDINIEYHGRMPRRNTGLSMSRDSGVNCVGLTDATCFQLERTPNSKKHNDTVLNNEHYVKNSIPQAASTPRENNLVVHQATVHETHVKLPQDSGFSSPRVDADAMQPQEQGFKSFAKHNQMGKSERGKHRAKRNSAAFKQRRNIFLSSDSLEITGSEFYPSYHGGVIPDIQQRNNQEQNGQQPGSSSISTSSTNQTVVERPSNKNYIPVGDYSEKQEFPGVDSDKRDKSKLRADSRSVDIHTNARNMHNPCNRDTEAFMQEESMKSTGLNNNVKMNNVSVTDRDAYKPRLYRCSANNDTGANQSNAVPSPVSQIEGRHLNNNAQSKNDRSSFLDNCQVVGVL